MIEKETLRQTNNELETQIIELKQTITNLNSTITVITNENNRLKEKLSIKTANENQQEDDIERLERQSKRVQLEYEGLKAEYQRLLEEHKTLVNKTENQSKKLANMLRLSEPSNAKRMRLRKVQ